MNKYTFGAWKRIENPDYRPNMRELPEYSEFLNTEYVKVTVIATNEEEATERAMKESERNLVELREVEVIGSPIFREYAGVPAQMCDMCEKESTVIYARDSDDTIICLSCWEKGKRGEL